MSKFCKNCTYYENGILSRIGESFGICHNNEATDKIMQDAETKLTEGTTTFTSQWFGCVYWRENDGSLINFGNIIDEDTGEPL